MLISILLVVVSFFAVIGVMEFILCIIETVAMRGTHSLTGIRIEADLCGSEPHIEFLLSSLSVMAERIVFRDLTTRLHINDCGIDQCTKDRIRNYTNENPNISLIEKTE